MEWASSLERNAHLHLMRLWLSSLTIEGAHSLRVNTSIASIQLPFLFELLKATQCQFGLGQKSPWSAAESCLPYTKAIDPQLSSTIWIFGSVSAKAFAQIRTWNQCGAFSKSTQARNAYIRPKVQLSVGQAWWNHLLSLVQQFYPSRLTLSSSDKSSQYWLLRRELPLRCSTSTQATVWCLPRKTAQITSSYHYFCCTRPRGRV